MFKKEEYDANVVLNVLNSTKLNPLYNKHSELSSEFLKVARKDPRSKETEEVLNKLERYEEFCKEFFNIDFDKEETSE